VLCAEVVQTLCGAVGRSARLSLDKRIGGIFLWLLAESPTERTFLRSVRLSTVSADGRAWAHAVDGGALKRGGGSHDTAFTAEEKVALSKPEDPFDQLNGQAAHRAFRSLRAQ
jgi:hypothetical protein